MKVKELIKKINLTLTTKPDFEDKEITRCYICDLLSRVMSKAQSGIFGLPFNQMLILLQLRCLLNVLALFYVRAYSLIKMQ